MNKSQVRFPALAWDFFLGGESFPDIWSECFCEHMFFVHVLAYAVKRPLHSVDHRSGEALQLRPCSYMWSIKKSLTSRKSDILIIIIIIIIIIILRLYSPLRARISQPLPTDCWPQFHLSAEVKKSSGQFRGNMWSAHRVSRPLLAF